MSATIFAKSLSDYPKINKIVFQTSILYYGQPVDIANVQFDSKNSNTKYQTEANYPCSKAGLLGSLGFESSFYGKEMNKPLVVNEDGVISIKTAK